MTRWTPKSAMRTAMVWFAAVWASFPATVLAQPPTYSYASLSAQCNSGAMQIRLLAHDAGEHPEIAGFHLYRRTLGSCDSSRRLTASPWTRNAGVDFTYTWTDATAPGGLAHEYHITAVDTNGGEVDAYTLFSVLDSQLYDISSCNVDAPIGAGTVEDWGWVLAIVPCPASCFDLILAEQFPPALRNLAGTGATAVVFGSFVCGTVEGCLGHVTQFAPSACQVAAQPRTWSGFKRLYR